MTHPKVKMDWQMELPIPDNAHEYIDMTMVSVFYDAGINELRKVATRKAVSHWIEQYHLPKEMMFIELGFNGVFTFSKEDFPEQIDYIRIDGNDSHKYLFQKEHLWNIAAKRAKYEKLMFMDSDIAPLEDVDWFKQVYDALDKCLFTQGFRNIIYLNCDDKQTRYHKLSFTFMYTNNQKLKYGQGVPGGVYCINKSTLETIGWFNTIVTGSSDTLFWTDMLGKPLSNDLLLALHNREYVNRVFDKFQLLMDKKLILAIPVDVFHFYHGEFKNRSYQQRNYMWATQYPWNGTIVTNDGDGLLKWIDTSYYFYNVMARFHTVDDNKYRANELMKDKIQYLNFIEDYSNKQSTYLPKYQAESILRELQSKYKGGSTNVQN